MLGIVTILLVGTSCGGDSSSQAVIAGVSAAEADLITAQPDLAGAPVVTVSGTGIDDRFADGLLFDIAALEQLPMVEVDIDDPWEKRQVTYRGVMMNDLVNAIAPHGARELQLTALDDYEVTLSLNDLANGKALLATTADGEPIDIAAGGPTRLVFLPDSTIGRDQDLWIWSIVTIVAQ